MYFLSIPSRRYRSILSTPQALPNIWQAEIEISLQQITMYLFLVKNLRLSSSLKITLWGKLRTQCNGHWRVGPTLQRKNICNTHLLIWSFRQMWDKMLLCMYTLVAISYLKFYLVGSNALFSPNPPSGGLVERVLKAACMSGQKLESDHRWIPVCTNKSCG